MDYAFEFVKKNGGIDTEEDYPFIEREGTCNKNKVPNCSLSSCFHSCTKSVFGPIYVLLLLDPIINIENLRQIYSR